MKFMLYGQGESTGSAATQPPSIDVLYQGIEEFRRGGAIPKPSSTVEPIDWSRRPSDEAQGIDWNRPYSDEAALFPVKPAAEQPPQNNIVAESANPDLSAALWSRKAASEASVSVPVVATEYHPLRAKFNRHVQRRDAMRRLKFWRTEPEVDTTYLRTTEQAFDSYKRQHYQKRQSGWRRLASSVLTRPENNPALETQPKLVAKVGNFLTGIVVKGYNRASEAIEHYSEKDKATRSRYWRIGGGIVAAAGLAVFFAEYKGISVTNWLPHSTGGQKTDTAEIGRAASRIANRPPNTPTSMQQFVAHLPHTSSPAPDVVNFEIHPNSNVWQEVHSYVAMSGSKHPNAATAEIMAQLKEKYEPLRGPLSVVNSGEIYSLPSSTVKYLSNV